LLRPRDEVLLFPFFKLIPNLVAGTLSGLVTYFVLPAFQRADAAASASSARDVVPTTIPSPAPAMPAPNPAARVPGGGHGRGSGGGRGMGGGGERGTGAGRRDTFSE